jgi:nicotinamidase-related amidase
MSEKLFIEPKTSALLVMDFQRTILEAYATDSDALLARTAELIAAVRKAKIMVVYIVVSFRPGYPEVSARNLSFGAIRSSGRYVEASAGSEVHSAVAPMPDEVVVKKHRVGAFTGTDLEMVLRASGIDTLVLAGIATSGVVLSTVRHAADADYRLVVVRDCCGDRDPEVHRVLTEKVFPRQATVIDAESVMQVLS